MSIHESTDDESTESETNSVEAVAPDPQPDVLTDVQVEYEPGEFDDRYETTTKSAYSSNGEASRAFSDMQIKPSRTARSSELGKRFKQTAFYHYGNSVHCYQFPSGAGLEESTNTQRRGGITFRLPTGNTLSGLTVDQLYDYLTTISDAGFRSAPSRGLTDVVAQHGAESERGFFDSQENFLIEFSDGAYLVVLYDGSANRRAQTSAQRAGLLIEPEDPRYAHVQHIHAREAYGQLSDLVAPDEVLASELPVVTSSDYRSGDSDRFEPDNVGGYGSEEMLGNVIIRQGEYYFIPTPDLDPDTVRKPLKGDDETPLGSHVSRDLAEINNKVYVRGTVRHTRNEHSMFNLYDEWHQVVENTDDLYAFERSGGGRME